MGATSAEWQHGTRWPHNQGPERNDLPARIAKTEWLARAVLHVRDVEASLRFCVQQLGSTSPWCYREDGKADVAQLERQGCAFILADTWPEKIGKG